MTRLLRAELLKLRTTRILLWSLAATLALVPLTIALAVYGAGGTDGPVLDSSEGVRNVMAAGGSGALMLLVVGIMSMAGEFRHRTITSTVLITPDRTRIVAAKLAAVAITGAAFTVLAAALTLAIALPWLSARDVDPGAHVDDVVWPLVGAMAATVVSGLVGVGLGALVRNQTAAVTLALVWTLTVESALVAALPEVGRWLPGGASSALTGVSTPDSGLLPLWAAALLLAAYGLAFAGAGVRLTARRDIA
jgi:hypothetical protein